MSVNFATIPNSGFYVPQVTGSVDIQTYASFTETDADDVQILVAQIGQDLRVRLGGGHDLFRLEAGNVGDDLDLDAGEGNDTAFLQAFIYDDLMARLGAGDDSLTLGYLRADQASLLGDGGVDQLFRAATQTQFTALTQTGWEFINGKPTWGFVGPLTPVMKLGQ